MELSTNETAKTAADYREALRVEYSTFTATEPIYIDGALAFATGDPVPVSHVETYPQLREVVAERAANEPPKGNASRGEWAAYATQNGAPADETRDTAEGGLSKAALMEKYGTKTA